jgi:four helix bundle protein
MQDLRNLRVLQSAHRLALLVYRATENFPQREKYGLAAETRRTAVSVASNISESCGRRSDREITSFLRIALGSAAELEYQLLLAFDLSFVAEPAYREAEQSVVDVKKMLNGLLARISQRATGKRQGEASPGLGNRQPAT